MDIQQILINFSTLLLALAVFFLLKNYFPKYFEAKGTNQATKEDIGEITEIVENIKSDLIQQNEFLKAQLSFKNQHALNLKTAEREAIFDYNKKISAWLYSLVRFSFTGYNLDNYKELKLSTSEFSKRQYECDLSEAHLVLFMHDNEFLEIKKSLTCGIIELEGIVNKSAHKVYWAYSKCEFEVEMQKDNPLKQSEIKGQLRKELTPIEDQLSDTIIKEFEKIHTFHVALTRLIYDRLKQLAEN
jgi:hypothetical protein